MRKNMETEDILVAIYINLIWLMYLPGIYQPSNSLVFPIGNCYK